MEFLYFAVKGSSAWTSTFHNNFFNTCGGFTMGLVGAIIIGIVIAVAFYLLCCNSKTSVRFATLPLWFVALLIAGALSYFFANNVVIGTPKCDERSKLYNYSFYKANVEYYNKECNGNVSDTFISDLSQQRNKIRTALDKGRDVRVPYSLTTAVYALIMFFITSIIIKRFTISGKSIPFLKP